MYAIVSQLLLSNPTTVMSTKTKDKTGDDIKKDDKTETDETAAEIAARKKYEALLRKKEKEWNDKEKTFKDQLDAFAQDVIPGDSDSNTNTNTTVTNTNDALMKMLKEQSKHNREVRLLMEKSGQTQQSMFNYSANLFFPEL